MKFGLIIVAIGLVGCAGPKRQSLHEKPAITRPQPERPATSRRGFVPTSDMVWFAEMLTQRLELARAAAWSRFVSGVEAPSGDLQEVRLRALVEPALRVGLPEAEVTRFYAAQLDAAALWERSLQRQWRHPGNRPSGPALSIEKSLRPLEEAVDTQILATLVRIHGIPRGKPFHGFLLKALRKRGIPSSMARVAAAPFRPGPNADPPPPVP